MNQIERALSIAYAELYVRMEKALALIAQLEAKVKDFEKKEQSIHEAK